MKSTPCDNCRYNHQFKGCIVNRSYWLSPEGTCTSYSPLSQEEQWVLHTPKAQMVEEVRQRMPLLKFDPDLQPPKPLPRKVRRLFRQYWKQSLTYILGFTALVGLGINMSFAAHFVYRFFTSPNPAEVYFSTMSWLFHGGSYWLLLFGIPFVIIGKLHEN